jgi:hypothetical protein
LSNAKRGKKSKTMDDPNSAKTRVIDILEKMIALLMLNDDDLAPNPINLFKRSIAELNEAEGDEIYDVIETISIHPKSDCASISIYKDGKRLEEEDRQYRKLDAALSKENFNAIVKSRGGL